MSASGAGGCGPGPGPGPSPGSGSGASNPRKFSEKIALHTQRQAEETAAFQEVMMDISSTRLQAQKRLARNQGPYYGGSLPDVNQIGRNHQDFQGSFSSTLESSRSTRHHGLVERVQRDRRFASPIRPYRNRQMDNSAYNPAYLSPPPDPSWRRTNSDSALHTSVMNPPSGDHFSPGHSLTPQPPRRTGQTEGEGRRMFPYPVPPIEENVLDEGKLLKPWDSKKLPMLSSRPKSCEVPGINIFPSPEQPSSATAHLPPAALNTGGSLPDLSSLHFPSPLPTPLDHDEPGSYPGAASLSGGNSTGNLASTLTQLGINQANGQGLAFHQHSPGLLASLQSALSHPSLHSSLSNPNIQSSLGSHSFPTSLSSTSLHSSLSNPSLQSSLCSSPSLTSSLSSQSLHSSLSNSSLSGQSVASGNPSYSSAVGVSGSCSSAYSPLLSGQGQPQLSTSPRRRAQLSPLILPLGGEGRRHPSKQFSPTISPTLSSITQGVPLDTSKLPLDQRLPPYAFNQPLHQQNHQQLQQNQQQQLHQNHHAQQNQAGCVPANSQQQQQQQPPPSSSSSSTSSSSSSSLGQQNPHHSQMHRLQQQNRPNPPPQPQHHPHHHPYQQQQQQQQPQQQQQLQQHQQEQQQQQQHNLQLQNLRNSHNQQLQLQQQHFGTQQRPASGPPDPSSTPLIKCETQLDQCEQSLQGHADLQRASGLMQLQQINHSLSPDLGLYNDSLFNSLLDDPYLTAQLTGRANQQFSMEGPGEGLSMGDGGLQDRNQYPSPQGSLELPDLGHHHHHHHQHQQLLNLHNHNYGSTEPRHTVPNILLTGGSPPGLSKEITSALSHVPGFEMDPFSLDDPLRMDPLSLDMLEGELMLADPAVEDSFRSDRLK